MPRSQARRHPSRAQVPSYRMKIKERTQSRTSRGRTQGTARVAPHERRTVPSSAATWYMWAYTPPRLPRHRTVGSGRNWCDRPSGVRARKRFRPRLRSRPRVHCSFPIAPAGERGGVAHRLDPSGWVLACGCCAFRIRPCKPRPNSHSGPSRAPQGHMLSLRLRPARSPRSPRPSGWHRRPAPRRSPAGPGTRRRWHR